MPNPLHLIDFYKSGHRHQYPVGTTKVYSNFTPRSGKLSNLPQDLHNGRVTFFGLQYFCKRVLQEMFDAYFFNLPKEKVIAEYKRRMDTSLGIGAVPTDHIEALHDLGYLPILIKALPEGVEASPKIPFLTIENTLPEFFWLTNYLETILSNYLWKSCTSATTARFYRGLCDKAATVTGAPVDFVPFQCHDFSFRGMSLWEDAALSGAAHLTSFVGTDTVAAIDLLERYYGADAEKELIGCSVPASEHSVMCMGGCDDEIGTFRRFITDLYPSGIVSIVSDTWDFWRVVTEYVTVLKPEILARNGKLVIRPDSGDPLKIICGDDSEPDGSPANIGALECLWEVFGGTVTETGHRVLDSHIGLIYGDSITPQRCHDILERMRLQGFASCNVVFGVGSFTYQYVTRDTHGFAVKSTYGEINGAGVDIYKDPKTDDGVKKSARGRIKVTIEGGEYCLIDQRQDDDSGELKPVFENGKLLRETTLAEIRERIRG